VNGVEVASQIASGSPASSTMPLRIGANTVYGEYFKGYIDDVKIYNKALTTQK